MAPRSFLLTRSSSGGLDWLAVAGVIKSISLALAHDCGMSNDDVRRSAGVFICSCTHRASHCGCRLQRWRIEGSARCEAHGQLGKILKLRVFIITIKLLIANSSKCPLWIQEYLKASVSRTTNPETMA
jgi:hypothetical protein